MTSRARARPDYVVQPIRKQSFVNTLYSTDKKLRGVSRDADLSIPASHPVGHLIYSILQNLYFNL
jgi:hypothetical protein